jgi:hypothetical protein
MVKVTVKIESYPTTDVYWRYHGLAIDQELNEDWWVSQPEKNIATTPAQPFSYKTTVELAEGEHSVEYAVSGYVPDYAWHAKIYVDGRLVAEGDVGRLKANHLKAKFTVGAAPPPPTPPTAETWWLPIALIGGLAGVIFVGGVIAYSEVRKHVG